nr:hypothetical protein [uncultured Anaeromusa sp.]
MSLLKTLNKNLQLPKRKEWRGMLVVFADTKGHSMDDLFKDLRRKGHLTVPMHFLVHEDGLIEEGRKFSEVAHPDVDPTGTLWVGYVDAPSENQMSEAQKQAVNQLSISFSGGVVEVATIANGRIVRY